jgi:hypothetical protein
MNPIVLSANLFCSDSGGSKLMKEEEGPDAVTIAKSPKISGYFSVQSLPRQLILT